MLLTTQLRLSSPIARTPRAIQLESLFDIAPSKKSVVSIDVKLDLPEAKALVGWPVKENGK